MTSVRCISQFDFFTIPLPLKTLRQMRSDAKINRLGPNICHKVFTPTNQKLSIHLENHDFDFKERNLLNKTPKSARQKDDLSVYFFNEE